MTIPSTWTRLAPGVYDDNGGGLHIAIAELLAAHGYPDTASNRAMLIASAASIFGDRITVTEDEIDARNT